MKRKDDTTLPDSNDSRLVKDQEDLLTFRNIWFGAGRRGHINPNHKPANIGLRTDLEAMELCANVTAEQVASIALNVKVVGFTLSFFKNKLLTLEKFQLLMEQLPSSVEWVYINNLSHILGKEEVILAAIPEGFTVYIELPSTGETGFLKLLRRGRSFTASSDEPALKKARGNDDLPTCTPRPPRYDMPETKMPTSFSVPNPFPDNSPIHSGNQQPRHSYPAPPQFFSMTNSFPASGPMNPENQQDGFQPRHAPRSPSQDEVICCLRKELEERTQQLENTKEKLIGAEAKLAQLNKEYRELTLANLGNMSALGHIRKFVKTRLPEVQTKAQTEIKKMRTLRAQIEELQSLLIGHGKHPGFKLQFFKPNGEELQTTAEVQEPDSRFEQLFE